MLHTHTCRAARNSHDGTNEQNGQIYNNTTKQRASCGNTYPHSTGGTKNHLPCVKGVGAQLRQWCHRIPCKNIQPITHKKSTYREHPNLESSCSRPNKVTCRFNSAWHTPYHFCAIWEFPSGESQFKVVLLGCHIPTSNLGTHCT